MRKLLGPNPRRMSLLAIALLAAAPAPRAAAGRSTCVSQSCNPARAARRGPARAHDAGREDRADHYDLDAEEAAVRQRRTLRSRGGAPPVSERHRPICPAERSAGTRQPLQDSVSGRAPDDRAGERHSALRVEHAPRHPGAVPRRGPARLRGARRHALSASHRAGELLGSSAAGAGVHCRRAGDSRARRAARACSGGRCRTRPALGSHRGNVRRRPVPRRRARRCSRAGISGPQSAARTGSGARDAEAHDRARPARERHQCRAGQYLRTHPARGLLPAVPRGGGTRQCAGSDAFVQRDRRRAFAREPLAAARRAARRNGVQGRGRQRLFRDRAVGRGASHDCRSRERRRPCAQGGRGLRSAGRRVVRPAAARSGARLDHAGRDRHRSAPHAAAQVHRRPVRAAVRGREASRGHHRQCRSPRARTRGCAQVRRPAQERWRAAAARGSAQDARGHRPECGARRPRRVLERAHSCSHACSTASRRRWASGFVS